MRSILILTCVAGALAGCYGLGDGTLAAGASGAGDGGTSGSGSAGGVTPTGLPCDVAQLLSTHCTSCHTDPPVSGPMGLVSHADLIAPAPSDATKTVAQVALARMQDARTPMPPAPAAAVSAAEIAAFQAWVNAGAPEGTCATTGGGPSPYDTPVVCTSKTTWTRGDRGSSSMHPGGTCISCHAGSGGEAPAYAIAGTVYPTAHEPLDCNGSSGATVVIVDATGKTLTLTTNAAGNFYSSAAITTPYHAKIVSNGKERAMVAAQTSGDCNACHTESGTNSAPGRLMLP